MTATASVRPTVDAAYEYCETVTRKAASNFYWGFRLLPGERRPAPRTEEAGPERHAVYSWGRE